MGDQYLKLNKCLASEEFCFWAQTFSCRLFPQLFFLARGSQKESLTEKAIESVNKLLRERQMSDSEIQAKRDG